MVKNYSFNKKKLLKCTAKKQKKPCINTIFRREFKDIRNKEKIKQATKETKIRKCKKSTQHFST
jgi:hypothetical protein